jgi:hypothetical protein
MTNKTTSHLIASFLAILAAGLAISLYLIAGPTYGNTITQGIVPSVASSSLMVVGPQSAVTLFAKNTGCAVRVVSTLANPVMLSFSSTLTPSATQGHVQAASTTVAYENGSYGCGQLSAYGFNASTSITVTQLNQP